MAEDQKTHIERIVRLESSIDYHSRSVDELKVSVKLINEKLDDIKTDINKAKGAANLTEWVTTNWPGIGAMLVAAAAFFKSGGPPNT